MRQERGGEEDIKRKEKTRPVCRALSFWYVIERFSSLHCSFILIYKAGECSLKEDVYINWSSLLQERSWGKRSATV